MLSVIEDKMEIVDLAKQAIASEGLTPLSRPIRGGTDGARLSFMGLPCPNLGTGGYGFLLPYEHISVEGMQTAVRILKILPPIRSVNKFIKNRPQFSFCGRLLFYNLLNF